MPPTSPSKTFERILVLKADGFDLTIGLNCRANEVMVKKHQELHPECLWFHAVGVSGPHAVLCLEGIEPGEACIKAAVSLVAERSFKESFTDRYVRMGRLKHVVKPQSGKEGSWMALPFMIHKVV